MDETASGGPVFWLREQVPHARAASGNYIVCGTHLDFLSQNPQNHSIFDPKSS